MTPGALVDLRSEFPVLAGSDIAYLDCAATAQTPQSVVDAMTDYYETARASVHRGVYPLAVESTDRFEGARSRIAAAPSGEISSKHRSKASVPSSSARLVR